MSGKEYKNSKKILIVDDSEINRSLLSDMLSDEYEILEAENGMEAVELVRRDPGAFDLAVLDVMMPEIDGLTLCRRIRAGHNYPIIMLTARDGELDKITGLTLGADDYITKPFLPLELVARIKSQLRRYKKYNPAHEEEEEKDTLVHLGLVMHVSTWQCTLNGKPLVLTPMEFAILRILLENRGM